MSLKKQYLKSKPECKVTFVLDSKQAENATKATLVGEFNDWNERITVMTKLKNGSFKVNLSLPTDHSYQFRYLVDGKFWINDDSADSYVHNTVSDEDNSVIKL